MSLVARFVRPFLIGMGFFLVTLSHADIYARLQASFNLPGLATDPFDPATTDVRVQIIQPDASSVVLPAFFDGGATWRVRHSPSLPGLYQIGAITLNGGAASYNNLQPTNFVVAGNPFSPGFVRIDPANSNRFITANGRRHFPLGHNAAWDLTSSNNVATLLTRLGAARENWSRVWMDHWDNKNLDWPKQTSFGTLNLAVAQKWDAIVAAAEQNGVSFQMVLHHHGQYSSSVDPNWAQNPYNSANGGFLTNAAQFFTNATAKALTQRKLRYAVARWGYSPAIMAWELFNEVQFTDAAQSGQWSIIGAWHNEMAQYLRSQDVYQHLVTTSSQLDQPIWTQTDYYQHHDYPSDLISALRDPAGIPAGQPLRPIFGGESGSAPAAFYGLSAPLWAGMMGVQSGAAQPWYWDRIDAESGYPLIRSASDFVALSGIPQQDTLARTDPHVTCPQSTALAFAAGGGWATASQSTFNVGESAPTGIGTLPNYLQGDFHRAMTPNGYVFNVNYPTAGTFSAQILTIAASGAALRLTVDNATTNLATFPATGSDVNTNFTLSIDVPAGAHTVRLWNPGLDWVNLGDLTLNPYTPMLGAYQIGNSNFAALWIWHRTNIYLSGASSAVGGTLPLSGLQAGNYSASWWDTLKGGVISNFTITVSGTNPATIPIPPVLRSLALFAGTAPQAAVSSPDLTRTLGTNSPSLNLQLYVTNSGCLPLAFSLSITGCSAVAYTAETSATSGGPQYAWRDYSVVGRDLSTNFIALTGKTAKDEGIAGPIDIGFAFPFFSGNQAPGLYTKLYVSPNGFVTFSPFAGDTSTNRSLPSTLAPTNLIAFFWDDLDLSTTGQVYAHTDPLVGEFILQFQNVRFKGTSASVTCQLILKTSGDILMLYRTMGASNACTVGVQNANGTESFQVAFNQNFLQTNFCVRLKPIPWLSLGTSAGLVPKNSVEPIRLNLNPAGISNGTYSATLVLQTSDPLLATVSLPIQLEVSSIAAWRQVWFGSADNFGDASDLADPDGDGLPNIAEYSLNTNPTIANPSPVSSSIATGYLEMRFPRKRPAPSDLTYLLDVGPQIPVGPWQSGPGDVEVLITDNLDGTETVVVRDNSPTFLNPSRFLRLRIAREP